MPEKSSFRENITEVTEVVNAILTYFTLNSSGIAVETFRHIQVRGQISLLALIEQLLHSKGLPEIIADYQKNP